jgi:altered-inheritance-of-mitochondria protein 5
LSDKKKFDGFMITAIWSSSFLSLVEKIKNVGFLMTTSMVLCNNLSFNTNQSQNPPRNRNSLTKSYRLLLQFGNKSRGFCGVVANAKKKGENHSKRKRGWWQRFFIDEEGNWLGLKDDDMLDAEAELSENSSDEELSEEEKFEAWKRRAEAIVDLREAQEDMLNEESRKWEDWIVDYGDNGHDDDSNGSWWSKEYDGNGGIGNGGSVEDVRSDPTDLVREKGFVESVRDLVFGREEEDLLYEDRVFRYASLNSVSEFHFIALCFRALPYAIISYVGVDCLKGFHFYSLHTHSANREFVVYVTMSKFVAQIS